MKLSRTERWMLANQYAILEHLDTSNADSYRRIRETLEEGYEGEYDWIAEHIYRDDDVMRAEDCSDVIDTLAMYDALQRSYDDLADKSGIDEHSLIFSGYDGNNEGKFMSYARHFCGRDRFTNLRKGDDGFNSHMPSVDRYRRMLEVWRGLGKSYALDKVQIQAIVDARRHR